MKVAITGGAGYIGSHVVDLLQERNIDVEVFDIVNNITDDVRIRDNVTHLVHNVDVVIHLAAILGTQETVKDPFPVVETNIIGSLNVFDACRKYKKRAVYIAVGNHWMNNPYSITKTTSERFALMYNKEFGTKIAVVRGLNAYGPRQKEKPVRKIMPNLILPALRGEDITIYGSGSQIMDMIHVRDLANVLVKALLDNHDIYDEPIEAGMGLDTTVNDLVKMVIDITCSSSKIIHVPMRPGEIPNSVVKADTKNLERLGISVSSLTPLRQGVQETVEWYKDTYFTEGGG